MLLAQAVEMWLWGSLQGYTGDPPLGAVGECGGSGTELNHLV
jgi:hypothetical protein